MFVLASLDIVHLLKVPVLCYSPLSCDLLQALLLPRSRGSESGLYLCNETERHHRANPGSFIFAPLCFGMNAGTRILVLMAQDIMPILEVMLCPKQASVCHLGFARSEAGDKELHTCSVVSNMQQIRRLKSESRAAWSEMEGGGCLCWRKG